MATATKAQTQTLEEKKARLAELQAEAQQLPDLIPAAARSGDMQEYVRLMARQAANPAEAQQLRGEITREQYERNAARILELNIEQPKARQAYVTAYEEGERRKLEIDREVNQVYDAYQAVNRELTRLTNENQVLAAQMAGGN